ncbi:MAG: VOC family protein [Patescibacteria group bacterium]
MKNPIIHLWFDTEAKNAADFYLSVFSSNASIINKSIINSNSNNEYDFFEMKIHNQELILISAGPFFKKNSSISMFVNYSTEEELREIYNKLSEGSKILMELGKYDFSPLYSWIEDKYGVSWQLIYDPQNQYNQVIEPCFLFTNEACGKAKEAMELYTKALPNSSIKTLVNYPQGVEGQSTNNLMYGVLDLNGYTLIFMDSSLEHDFNFNEGVSVLLNVENQTEFDNCYKYLSDAIESEQCGWVKDKYGISWQIQPIQLVDIMRSSNVESKNKVIQKILTMKRLEIGKILEVFNKKYD